MTDISTLPEEDARAYYRYLELKKKRTAPEQQNVDSLTSVVHPTSVSAPTGRERPISDYELALAESPLGGMIKKIDDTIAADPGRGLSLLPTRVVFGLVNEIAKSPLDITMSVAGGIVGAGLGSMVAPGGGTVAGGTMGGVAGGAIGKTLDDILIREQNASKFMSLMADNAARAGGEELVARLIGPVFGSMATKVLPTRKGEDISDLLISGRSLPRASGDILTAQDRIFGYRPLTVFEATKGAVGRELQAELERSQQRAIGKSIARSAVGRERLLMQEKMRTVLADDAGHISDKNFVMTVNRAFSDAMKLADTGMEAAKGPMRDLEEKVMIPSGGILAAFDDIEGRMRQEIGDDVTDMMRSELESKLLKEVDGEVVLRTKIPASEMNVLRKNIVARMDKFNPAGNFQSEANGVIAKYVLPILKKAEDDVFDAAKLGTDAAALASARADFAAASALRNELKNSSIMGRIGVKELAQMKKGNIARNLENVLFASPQSWEEATRFFDLVDPRLSGIMVDRFKHKILAETLEPRRTGAEMSLAKLEAFSKKYPPETIAAIAGPSYAQHVNDMRLITLALETTQPAFTPGGTALSAQQKLFENIRRMLIHPLAGRVGTAAGLMSKFRTFVGMGDVTDDEIFKLMQGDKGIRLMQEAINNPLTDPTSYNTYIQVVREINKARDSGSFVPELTRREYFLGIMDGLGVTTEQIENKAPQGGQQ